MNSIAKTIMREGIVIPFNNKGLRIPMDKKSERFPFLTQIPDYLLVILPDYPKEFYSSNYINRTFSFHVSRNLLDEWMPAIRIDHRSLYSYLCGGDNISRIADVTLESDDYIEPVLYDLSHLSEIVKNDKKLSHYIYKLDCIDTDHFSMTSTLSFKAIELYHDKNGYDIISPIQHWFSDLLGLPYMHSMVSSVDISSLFPPFEERVYKGGYVFPNRHYDNRILYDMMKTFKRCEEKNMKLPEIKKVIFNKPAVIVLWEDGTKTVVKAQGKSRYDREKGLAMAIAKKALGNEGNYYNEFRKWLE